MWSLKIQRKPFKLHQLVEKDSISKSSRLCPYFMRRINAEVFSSPIKWEKEKYFGLSYYFWHSSDPIHNVAPMRCPKTSEQKYNWALVRASYSDSNYSFWRWNSDKDWKTFWKHESLFNWCRGQRMLATIPDNQAVLICDEMPFSLSSPKTATIYILQLKV